MDALVQDVAWLGNTRLSLRSDNEPAIWLLLKHALTEARYQIELMEQIMEEHPNTYDSAANGEVEATAKQVTGILRTNRLDLEKRIQREILLDYPVHGLNKSILTQYFIKQYRYHRQTIPHPVQPDRSDRQREVRTHKV